MGLFAKALIFGAGYALGHPQGRRQLVQLRQQASQLAQDPRVNRAKEQARTVAGDQALAVKNRVAGARFRRSPDTGAAPATSSGTHRAQPAVPPVTDRTAAVDTSAARTAAAADSVWVAPTTDDPTPPVPPVGRP
ncbi:MAG TPA: hypothetical protein VNP92_10120 [Actinophytocola sp.]|nr:hypothetical protein [Actinophytocola sp.]